LLKAHGFLDKLLLVASNSTVVQRIGLPPRCLRQLKFAVGKNLLAEDDLMPAVPLDGWQLRMSQSTGVPCFQQVGGNSRQWLWPAAGQLEPFQFTRFVEPSAPAAEQLRATSSVVRLQKLMSFSKRMEELVRDLELSLGEDGAAEGFAVADAHIPLFNAWRMEVYLALRHAVDEKDIGDDSTLTPVAASFWHKLVKPKLDAVETEGYAPQDLLRRIKEIYERAKALAVTGPDGWRKPDGK